MKWTWWLLIHYLLINVNGYVNRSRQTAYYKALWNISKFLGESNREIIVSNFLGDEAFLDSTVFKTTSEQGIPVNFTNYHQERQRPQFYEQQGSGIAVFQSVNLFSRAYSLFLPTYSYPKSLHVFVLFHEGNAAQVQEIVDLLGNRHVYYFLVEGAGFISLMTFVFYTPELCHRRQLIEINRFDIATLKWKSDTFGIEKFNNFHGCTINIAFPAIPPEYAVVEIDYEKETIKCLGYLCKATEDLSRNLNFKYFSNAGRISNRPKKHDQTSSSNKLIFPNKNHDFHWFLVDMSAVAVFLQDKGTRFHVKGEFPDNSSAQ